MKKVAYLLFFCLALLGCDEKKLADAEGITVAFYNVENLFDTKDDPTKYDEQYTPKGDRNWDKEKYATKLKNLAEVISQISEERAPEFLGVCEIENKYVLQDLIKEPKLKDAHYDIAHIESPDERGIDVGFLYNKNIFKVTDIRAVQPDLSAFDDKTRDILVVEGELANGQKLYFAINHWPSRGEGQRKSEPKRLQAAQALKNIKDEILSNDSQAKIIVMGDFNDEPSNKSISNTLAVSCIESSTASDQLFNAFCKLEKEDKGSYKYRSYWDMLDQIMVSDYLLEDTTGVSYISSSASIKNEHWMQQHGNKYEGSPLRTFGGRTYLAGYSDHFPVYIKLRTATVAD